MFRKGKHLSVPKNKQLTSSLQGIKKTHRIDPIGRLHMSEFQMTLDDARSWSED